MVSCARVAPFCSTSTAVVSFSDRDASAVVTPLVGDPLGAAALLELWRSLARGSVSRQQPCYPAKRFNRFLLASTLLLFVLLLPSDFASAQWDEGDFPIGSSGQGAWYGGGGTGRLWGYNFEPM